MSNSILLVHGSFDHVRISEPLGISALASVLRKTHDVMNVAIYDPCLEGDSIDTALKKVLDVGAQIIGISISEEIAVESCLAFVKLIVSKASPMAIIIGGHVASLRPERFLVNGVSAVFIGECEVSLPAFIKAIENHSCFATIPGIAYKGQDGVVRYTPMPSKIEDLDSLPFPARDIFSILQKKYGTNIPAQITSSRGCQMNCSYCSIKAFSRLQSGKAYRQRSVDSVVFEMELLYTKYNVTRFLFEDDNYIPVGRSSAREKVAAFCRAIRTSDLPDIKFYVAFRPDSIRKELVEDLKSVGLHGIFVGVESINLGDLRVLGRKGDPNEIRENIINLQNLGYRCDRDSALRLKIGYIMFNPYSDFESLTESYEFLRSFDVTPKKLITRVIAYNDTPIRDRIESDRLLRSDGSWDFKCRPIQKLYSTIETIVNRIMVFRERVRMPEKMRIELGKDTPNEYLVDLRRRIDSMCFDAFDDLLNASTHSYFDIQQEYSRKIESVSHSQEVVRILDEFEQKQQDNQLPPTIFR